MFFEFGLFLYHISKIFFFILKYLFFYGFLQKTQCDLRIPESRALFPGLGSREMNQKQ